MQAAKGVTISDRVVETHPQAIRMTWSEYHALRRACNDYCMLQADSGLKEIIQQSFIPGIGLQWFLVPGSYHPNRNTILFSSARSFRDRDGGMCSQGGFSLYLGRLVKGRTPCSSRRSQERRRGLLLGSLTRRCAGSSWHHRHLTLVLSLNELQIG